MRKIMAVALAALTLGGAVAITSAPAEAQEWRRGGGGGGWHNNGPRQYNNYRHGPRYGRHYDRGPRWGYRGYRGYGYGYRDNGGAVAAGIIGGLAAGAIIGSAAQANNSGGSAAAYCAQRYRSYDPRSGTYLNYDGNRYPCP